MFSQRQRVNPAKLLAVGTKVYIDGDQTNCEQCRGTIYGTPTFSQDGMSYPVLLERGAYLEGQASYVRVLLVNVENLFVDVTPPVNNNPKYAPAPAMTANMGQPEWLKSHQDVDAFRQGTSDRRW